MVLYTGNKICVKYNKYGRKLTTGVGREDADVLRTREEDNEYYYIGSDNKTCLLGFEKYGKRNPNILLISITSLLIYTYICREYFNVWAGCTALRFMATGAPLAARLILILPTNQQV
jgi:hypothetical protein